VAIPDHVSFPEAAVIMVAYRYRLGRLVAIGALAAAADGVDPGCFERVSVAAIQIANCLRARPIALEPRNLDQNRCGSLPTA